MDDIHLRVLNFANENPSGITIAQLKSEFPDDFYWLQREIHNKNLFTQGERNPYQEGGKLYLTFEDRFRLLEHEELKSANQSSKTATYFATAALAVSIFSAGASVYFSLNQEETQTLLNKDQLEQLLSIKNEEINKQFQSLINKQEETTKAIEKSKVLPENSPNKILESDS